MAGFAFYVGRVLLIFAVLPLAYALRLTFVFIQEATTDACSVGASAGPCWSKQGPTAREPSRKKPYSVTEHVQKTLRSAREKQEELESFVAEYSYLERYISKASSAIESSYDENRLIQRNTSCATESSEVAPTFSTSSSGRNGKTELIDSNSTPHGTV